MFADAFESVLRVHARLVGCHRGRAVLILRMFPPRLRAASSLVAALLPLLRAIHHRRDLREHAQSAVGLRALQS